MKCEKKVIELGTASTATKGAFGPGVDIRLQLASPGLADD
ncbi:benenodin family lasso peptide [Tsuneonella deserti]|nr:benenodin family lasso peptide [Tsuneonella deserti]